MGRYTCEYYLSIINICVTLNHFVISPVKPFKRFSYEIMHRVLLRVNGRDRIRKCRPWPSVSAWLRHHPCLITQADILVKNPLDPRGCSEGGGVLHISHFPRMFLAFFNPYISALLYFRHFSKIAQNLLKIFSVVLSDIALTSHACVGRWKFGKFWLVSRLTFDVVRAFQMLKFGSYSVFSHVTGSWLSLQFFMLRFLEAWWLSLRDFNKACQAWSKASKIWWSFR